MATALLALLALLAALSWLSRLSRHRRSATSRLPPGPAALPLLGNVTLTLRARGTLRELLKLSERYGPVFTVWLGPRPVVVLRGPEAIREALVGNAEAFSGRGRFPTVESTFRGHGLVFSDGERWRRLRRFSLSALRDLGLGSGRAETLIQDEAQELLRELQSTQGEPLEPTLLLNGAAANVACGLVLGTRFSYRDPEFLRLLRLSHQTLREMSSPAAQLYNAAEPFLPFLPGPQRRIPRLVAELREFISRLVRERERSLEPQCPRDFIDAFLVQGEKERADPGSEFSRENLELTVVNLFLAGAETVGATLRWALLLLLRHPRVLEKVSQELGAELGSGRPPALADRARLPYTDAAIHEIQRCCDLVPMGIPHRLTRDTEFRGFRIPKGTDVLPLLSSALSDPGSFKNPQNFDPENFLDERGRFRRSDAFLPFSAGRRLCLGEGLARSELFLFLTTILQRLRPEPLGPPEGLPGTPEGGAFAHVPPRFRLRFRPR